MNNVLPQVNNVLPIVMPPQSREPVVSAASLSETTQPKLPTQSAPQQPAQPPKEKRVIVQQPPQVGVFKTIYNSEIFSFSFKKEGE
jgi:hypothetical protein